MAIRYGTTLRLQFRLLQKENDLQKGRERNNMKKMQPIMSKKII
jgi:hypothetical protein